MKRKAKMKTYEINSIKYLPRKPSAARPLNNNAKT